MLLYWDGVVVEGAAGEVGDAREVLGVLGVLAHCARKNACGV